jgi:uncharacterized circularly permuted ATP-grasp superfamily protein
MMSFFAKNGEVRDHYRDVMKIYEKLSDREKEKIQAATIKDFTGDNAVLPLPRILAEKEYATLKAGVEQRGKALRAFLNDHYSGKKTYVQNNIIPTNVLQNILNRNAESRWQEFLRPEHIESWWYGPDVIRDPDGHFRVIEDNTGFVGGVGDLRLSSETLLKRVKGYEKSFDRADPQFYRQMVETYQKVTPAGEKIVMIHYPKIISADNEDSRVVKILSELGVESVALDPSSTRQNGKNKISFEKDGVYLLSKDKKEKIGFIIANMDAADLDKNHPAHRVKRALIEAKSLIDDDSISAAEKNILEDLILPDQQGNYRVEAIERHLKIDSEYEYKLESKSSLDGLMRAVDKGQIKINNPPGLEFINDKEFYMYVEKLVKFYLKEEPIIHNIETRSFGKHAGNKVILDQKILDEVFFDFEKYVVKKVDGRGGDAVWVGPKMNPSDLPAVKERVMENPAAYIVQRYTGLSQMDGYIVDLRAITNVSQKSVIVSDTPWGRAVKFSGGDGKVNVSASGRVTAVIVQRAICSEAVK